MEDITIKINELESKIAELYQQQDITKTVKLELQIAELELEKAKILYEKNNEYHKLSDIYNKKDYIFENLDCIISSNGTSK